MEQMLESLQQQLDNQKYFQSAIVKQDLSGLMEYCENCAFKKMNTEMGRFICNLDYKSVLENKVCAKNLRRNQNEAKRNETKPRTTRKRSDGKG